MRVSAGDEVGSFSLRRRRNARDARWLSQACGRQRVVARVKSQPTAAFRGRLRNNEGRLQRWSRASERAADGTPKERPFRSKSGGRGGRRASDCGVMGRREQKKESLRPPRFVGKDGAK